MLDSLFAKKRDIDLDISTHREKLNDFNQLKSNYEQKISDLKEKIEIETLYINHMTQTRASLNHLILQIQHGGIDTISIIHEN
jgi:transposase